MNYLRPLRIKAYVRYLGNRKNRRRLAAHYLLATSETPVRKSAAIGVGIAIGILPVWGFQMVVALFVASIFRLNKVITVIATHISFPPFIPFIIFLSFKTGSFWVKEKGVTLKFSGELTTKTVQANLLQYIYGSVSLAIFAGLLSFILCYCIISTAMTQRAKTGIK